MPDTLSLSAGVSLGLIAGIVSGVCYLFANGLAWSNEEHSERRCITASSEREVCRRCGGDSRGGLVPCICYPHSQPVKFESGARFLQQAQRAASLMPWTISTEKLEQIEEECEGRDSPGPSQSGQAELGNVREFLETLSAKLAGGALEGTRVAPLYDHPTYIPERNASPSRSTSRRQRYTDASSGASGAHVQLKRLVARVVEEAAALPALARYAAEPAHTPTIDSSTYEDLLATAILNKVIERYQTENGSGGRSSGIHSASASPSPSERSTPRSLNSTHARDISPPLREEEDVSDWEEGEAADDSLEIPRRVPFPEFGGDIVHQDDDEDRDLDEISGSDIQAVDGSWEENWLFQKKKIKTQSVPVPMLVPNSNADYRALIGDRDAEDTTDLSDNASDGEEDSEFKSDAKRVVDAKHIIGGQLKLDDSMDFEPDSLNYIDDLNMELNGNDNVTHSEVLDAVNKEVYENNHIHMKNAIDSGYDPTENGKDSILVLDIDSGPVPKAEFALNEEIHRTMINGPNKNFNMDDLSTQTNGDTSAEFTDNFPDKKESIRTLSRHEREKDYEETVTVPVQRHVDSLRRKHFEDEPQIPTRDTDSEDLIPGSIAYRERKKWLNYVEMPNNPYSPEAIQKRLLAKSTSSLFDTITTKNKDFEEKSTKETKQNNNSRTEELPVKEDTGKNLNDFNNASSIHGNMNGTECKSPIPKTLNEVLVEEVPQYKRYGRDYYLNETTASNGCRKKNSFSDTSSMSSINKSTSLDNFETEFASPVSASSSFSDLEAAALHQNIVRAVLSPRNASPNFAINPIFENPDRQNNADENHVTDAKYVNRQYAKVRPSRTVCDEGDGYVENEDIVRLKIPNKPEITEDLFEAYNKVRRSNTLRSDDLCVRAMRRHGQNFTFGGSLSFSTITTVFLQELVGLLIKQINTIATHQQYNKFAVDDQITSTTIKADDDKNKVLIEYDDDNEQTLYSAMPIYLDDDTDAKFEEIVKSAKGSPEVSQTNVSALHIAKDNDAEQPLKSPDNVCIDNSYISSSSTDDSIKIYNVQAGKVVKCKSEDNVSLMYESLCDKNDNIDITDKNISGETLVDRSSANSDVADETVIIEELNEDKVVGGEIEDILPQLPKVKELAKKFVSMENLNGTAKPYHPVTKRRKSREDLLNFETKSCNKQYMHSLTARSISKEFRDELKLSMATPFTVPGGSKEIPDGEEVTKESSRPSSPLPEPGTIKSKLAFFESLKNKISNK